MGLLGRFLITIAISLMGFVIFQSVGPSNDTYAHDYSAASSSGCTEGHSFEAGAPPAAPGSGVCRHPATDEASQNSSGIPNLGTITPPEGFPVEANAIISTLVQFAIAAAGLIFFAIFVIGGFRYLTAGGDEKAASEARKTLTNGFIGLIIIVAGFMIAQILFSVFGLSPLVDVVNRGGDTEQTEEMETPVQNPEAPEPSTPNPFEERPL